MILKQISILNYKNLRQAQLDFSPGINCFIGSNGEGKTNLLDAIYFLSFTRSAGNAIDSLNIRHGEDFFMLQGHYDLDGTDEDITCSLKQRNQRRTRKAFSERCKIGVLIWKLLLYFIQWTVIQSLPLKELPKEEFAHLVKNADVSIKSRAWNDKKISSHHAIIPTRIKAEYDKLSEVEQNLYLMVAQAYLAQFYLPHEYKSTKVIILFADEKFVGKGKTVTQIGWKAIYKNVIQNESKESESILLAVCEGESVKYISSSILEKNIDKI